MALPTVQGVANGQGNTAAATVSWPASHQADDIGLLFLETDDGEAAGVASPSGWVEVTDSPQDSGANGGNTGTRLTVFWKRATSGAEGDVTTTDAGDHTYARIISFRGCETSGNPWDVTAGDNANSASSGSIPGDTTTVADCLIVAAISRGTDTASAAFSNWANGDLANVAEIADAGTAQGSGGGVGVATGEKASAGTFGATTVTLAATSGQGRIMIALKPPQAAAGGGIVFDPNPFHHLLVR
jgi:hypothetical protein